MSLRVTNYVDEEINVFAKAGIYMSSKGSMVMVPEGSSKGSTEPALNMEICMVLDVDTGCLFLKKKRNLKGVYRYVCPWSDVEMVLGGNEVEKPVGSRVSDVSSRVVNTAQDVLEARREALEGCEDDEDDWETTGRYEPNLN